MNFWALKNRHRGLIYRRWVLDIWGLITTRKYKKSHIANFFWSFIWNRMELLKSLLKRLAYQIEPPLKRNPYKRMKEYFLSIRLNWFFYLTINSYLFKLYRTRAGKKFGSFISNYLTLLECRLMMFIYRLNLISNLFLTKSWVQSGCFIVNGISKVHWNLNIKIGDILSVGSLVLQNLLLLDMLVRLKYNVLFFNFPRFIFSSLKHFFFYIYIKPKITDLAYPIKKWRLDIFRGGDFFK